MSHLSKITLLLLTLFAFTNAWANDRLIGHWEGRWDGAFKTILSISKAEKHFKVVYQWEESMGSPFIKQERIGQIVNSNTILAKNIYIVSHPNDNDRAIAIGVFDQQTRMAYLKRAPAPLEK